MGGRHNPDVTPRLSTAAWDLIRRQRHVVAYWQLRSLGVPGTTIRRACSGSRGWMRMTRHAYLTLPMEPQACHRRAAACLGLGNHAVLAGTSALIEAGWTAGASGSGGAGGLVDVIVPRGFNASRRVVPPWIRVHSIAIDDSSLGTIPRTPVHRSAIDAAIWARSDREAVFILSSAAQAGVVSPARLAQELARRSRPKRAAVLRDAIAIIDGGSLSMGEVDFVRECRRRGLPAPRRQTRRTDSLGRPRYTDVEMDLPDGRLLLVEIDGAGHFDIRQWSSDMERHNALAVRTAAIILRVTTWQIRYDPDRFFDQSLAPLFGSSTQSS